MVAPSTSAPFSDAAKAVFNAAKNIFNATKDGAVALVKLPVKIVQGVFSAGGSIGSLLLKPAKWLTGVCAKGCAGLVKGCANFVSWASQVPGAKYLLGAALLATVAVSVFSVVMGKKIKNAPHAAAGETLEAAYRQGRAPSQEPNYAEIGEAQGINYSQQHAARVSAGREQTQTQQVFR